MLPPVQVGIIGGTGAEGRGLAARLAAAAVHTLLGSREIERARAAVERIAKGAAPPVEPAINADVVERSDLIFLTIPFPHVAAAIQSYRGRLRPGTVLVDVTVPLRFVAGAPVFEDLPEGSAAEHLRTLLPPDVRLAATLKTVPASLLGRVDTPLDCDEFVCGDSPEASAAAMHLLGRLPGLRLLDAGGLEAARTLERMAVLAIGLNRRYHAHTTRFRVVGL